MASSGESTALVDREVLGEVAFKRRFAEFQQLTPKEIIRVNLDVPRAIARGYGALPIIRANRHALESALVDFDFPLVDALEDYTLALHHAHTEWLVRAEPQVLTQEMLLEGRALRQVMLTDLKALANHGLVNPEKWRELKRDIGHVNLATDLSMLATVLDKCRGAGPVALLTTVARTQDARALSKTILLSVGRGRRRDAEWIAVNEQRDRVFTLFVRSYREARAGILFVKRGDNHIERQLPSLWPGRPRRRGERASAGADEAMARETEESASLESAEVSASDGTDSEVSEIGELAKAKRASDLIH